MGHFAGRVLRWIATVAARLIAWVDRIWDQAGARVTRRRRTGEAALAAVIVLYLAVNTARTSLDQGIAKIHAIGVSGVSTNSLHGGTRAERTAFTTWEDGYTRLKSLLGHHPVTLAQWQTLLELLLVPLSFLVWYGVNKALRKRIARRDDALRRPILIVLGGAAIGVIGYTVLGVLDQLAELAILRHGGPIAGVDQVLRVSGGVRTLLLPLFLIPVGIGLIQLERDHRSDPGRVRWWRGAPATYRVLIVVAALHSVILLVSIPGQQTQDALRLWLATPALALVGLVSTSLLSLALATIALRLGTDAEPKRVVLERHGTVRMVVVGALLALFGALARIGPGPVHRQPWGAGVLAAGGLVLVVGLLSLPLAPATAQVPPPTVDAPQGDDQPVTGVGAGSGAGTDLAKPGERVMKAAPAVLALVPLTALTIVLVRAAVPSIMDKATSGWLVLYAVAAAALAVLGFCLARACARWAFDRSSDGSRRATFYVVEALMFAVCLVVYVAVVHDPWRWARDLGVTGVVTVFLTVLVLVFGTLGYLMESKALPAALDFVGFRRLPVVLSLIAWGLVSHQLATPGFHDLKTIDGVAMPATPQLTVEDAFHRWVTNNLPEAAATPDPGPRTAVPMVFVAAAGGGIKAAAFTAATIDCIFQGVAEAEPTHPCATSDRFGRLFAASGASGGSVGIASVVAERAEGTVPTDWVAKRLGHDLLTPELAWQLFVEVPNAIVDFDPGLDRGEVLQESWRREFVDGDHDPGGAPYYTDTSAIGWKAPLTFLSGTNLNDGCRVNISAVRSAQPGVGGDAVLAPGATRNGACSDQRSIQDGRAPDLAGTRDLTDYLCGKNIDLATAAFLSSRFPLVSPTGTYTCEDHDPFTSDSLSVGDGGYRDNSGASSIMDAYSALEPLVDQFNAGHDRCIVPILVEINNGYAGFGAPGSAGDVAQLVAPALGAAKVFSDLSYGQIEQAAAEFSRPLSPDVDVLRGGDPLPTRFFQITLVDHPGVTAALGWSLSRAAVDDLVGQLDLEENRAALQSLRQLLDPATTSPLTCT
jgi:hypothetical protein